MEYVLMFPYLFLTSKHLSHHAEHETMISKFSHIPNNHREEQHEKDGTWEIVSSNFLAKLTERNAYLLILVISQEREVSRSERSEGHVARVLLPPLRK